MERPRNSLAALEQLGIDQLRQNQIEAALTTFRKLYDANPLNEFSCSHLAAVCDMVGCFDEGEIYWRQAIMRDPNFAAAHLGLGMNLLKRGNLRAGFAEFEFRPISLHWRGLLRHGYHWFDRRGPNTPIAEVYRANAHVAHDPRSIPWNGQQLNGSSIYLRFENGYGDTLQFVRYATVIAKDYGGRVMLAMPPELQRLLSTVPGITGMFSDVKELPDRYHTALIQSLPALCATTLETIPADIPYLAADPEPWCDFLNSLPGLKVGLVWAGNDQAILDLMDSRRSTRLASMLPLLRTPGCSFVSLQKGNPASQLADLPADVTVHNPMDRVKDWADTAGLMAGLDLIISVDTSCCHLAGALGKPVWLLNRFDTCWRWMLDRSDSPWYPTMRIFRQPRLGDWASVVAAVQAELARVVSNQLVAPGCRV